MIYAYFAGAVVGIGIVMLVLYQVFVEVLRAFEAFGWLS